MSGMHTRQFPTHCTVSIDEAGNVSISVDYVDVTRMPGLGWSGIVADVEWDDANVTTHGACDQCGKDRLVAWLPDPFTAEINPESDNPETWWCRPCFSDRADDI